jgi:hypothetical protein
MEGFMLMDDGVPIVMMLMSFVLLHPLVSSPPLDDHLREGVVQLLSR